MMTNNLCQQLNQGNNNNKNNSNSKEIFGNCKDINTIDNHNTSIRGINNIDHSTLDKRMTLIDEYIQRIDPSLWKSNKENFYDLC